MLLGLTQLLGLRLLAGGSDVVVAPLVLAAASSGSSSIQEGFSVILHCMRLGWPF